MGDEHAGTRRVLIDDVAEEERSISNQTSTLNPAPGNRLSLGAKTAAQQASTLHPKPSTLNP